MVRHRTEWLSEVLKVKVNFNSSICLFHDVTYSVTVRHPWGWIILFSSTVFKKLLLRHWKSIKPPILQHWKIEMLYYLNIEKILAIENNRIAQFAVWDGIMKAVVKGHS